ISSDRIVRVERARRGGDKIEQSPAGHQPSVQRRVLARIYLSLERLDDNEQPVAGIQAVPVRREARDRVTGLREQQVEGFDALRLRVVAARRDGGGLLLPD